MVNMDAVMAAFSAVVVNHSDPYVRDDIMRRVFEACEIDSDYVWAECKFEELAAECLELGLGDIAELWVDCARDARSRMQVDCLPRQELPAASARS